MSWCPENRIFKFDCYLDIRSYYAFDYFSCQPLLLFRDTVVLPRWVKLSKRLGYFLKTAQTNGMAARAAAKNTKQLKPVRATAPLEEPDSEAAPPLPVAVPVPVDEGTDKVEDTTALVDATLTVAVPSSTVKYMPARGPWSPVEDT